MAFTTGTASHHNDLLDDLRTWLVGTVGWTSLDYTAGATATDEATLSLSAPGATGGGTVYVNISTHYDVGNAYYGWQLFGATGWQSGLGHDSQQGAGGGGWINLWQNSIDYWFYANDRRFIVEAKVNTNYLSCYCGHFLPFALPSEYPYPLAIIGNYPSQALATVSNARNSFIADPGGDGAAKYRRRTTETWIDLDNQDNSSSNNDPSTGQRAFVWPHKTGRSIGSDIQSPNNWSASGFNSMKLNANNEAPIIQCHIVDMLDGALVGALDGVYSTTGFNRSTEQLLSYGGRDFRLFQRVFKDGPGDFMAIEEV